MSGRWNWEELALQSVGTLKNCLIGYFDFRNSFSKMQKSLRLKVFEGRHKCKEKMVDYCSISVHVKD